MDKEFEAKVRELLDREDKTEAEMTHTMYEFMLLIMRHQLDSSK